VKSVVSDRFTMYDTPDVTEFSVAHGNAVALDQFKLVDRPSGDPAGVAVKVDTADSVAASSSPANIFWSVKYAPDPANTGVNTTPTKPATATTRRADPVRRPRIMAFTVAVNIFFILGCDGGTSTP
jgi:hypothetical protein